MKRFRFGLRWLILVLSICALPAAWVGSLRRQLVDERNAIRDVHLMGASVSEKPNLDSRWIVFKSWLAGGPLETRVTLSFQNRNRPGDEYGPFGSILKWNEANIQTLGPIFRRLPGVESISFWRSPLPLGSLEKILPDSQRIEYLDLSVGVGQSPGTEIGPQDFAALSQLPNLQRLNLSSTNVTDDDLVRIAKLDLRLLHLQDTRITDEGIRILAEMKNLEKVDLGLTRVTEKVVPILAKWQVSKQLLVPAEWSSGAIGELRLKLPAGCTIRKTAYHFRFRQGAKAYHEYQSSLIGDQ